MGDLERDTAVETVERSTGRYRARLSRDWEIWGPNGGYLAVVALRAAGTHTRLGRPASFTCHFLGVADFDDVDLEVRPLRESKRAASLAVTMRQHDRPILEAVTWVVGDVDGLEHDAAPLPAGVAPPDELPAIGELVGSSPSAYHRFWSNFEERPLTFIRNWEEREPGDPLVRSWFRYVPRDTFTDPFVDAGRALLLVDTLGWPAAVRAHRPELAYYAPSIDVSARFHARAPESPWLLVEARSPVARDGLVAAAASVWSTDGRLVASGGQQMLCRPMSLQGG
ncbi:MAG TPA: thioesterase family protein [Acidimicrobiia bacterium]